MENLVVTIDFETARTLILKRRRLWSAMGAGLFALFIAIFLLFVPQSITSKTSIEFPQSPATNGMLGARLGIAFNSSVSRYIGLILSRQYAQEVAQRVHLQALYHLPSAEMAGDVVSDGIGVDDNARDNLLYIYLTLPSPAPFAPGAAAMRARVQTTAALAVNTYAELFRKSLKSWNQDNETTQFRESENRQRLARRRYDDAVQRLMEFVRSRQFQIDLSGDGEPAGSIPERQLLSLYIEREQLETNIQSAQSALEVFDRLQEKQLQGIKSLPDKDPLLTQARISAAIAQKDLDNLRIQYSDDSPLVIQASERLRIAQATLRQQVQTVRQGRTAQRLQAQVSLSALKARYRVMTRQIADDERQAHTNRELAIEYQHRRDEVTLRLQVFQKVFAQTEAASLRAESARNRIAIVDGALPPTSSSPDLVLITLISLFITILFLVVRISSEYHAFARTQIAHAEGFAGRRAADDRPIPS